MINEQKLRKLYINESLSMQEIALKTGRSLHHVQYWMKKYGVASRSRSEAVYLKLNPYGDPFSVKKKFTNKDLLLLGLGLGIWWGEGYKRHKGAVRVGNSDPRLIKAFLMFLKDICGVRDNKFRFGLQVFNDIDPHEAKRYWVKELNVSSVQFLPKVVMTPKRGLGTYKHRSKYGVLTIYCINTKLRKVMDVLMEKYAFQRVEYIKKQNKPT